MRVIRGCTAPDIRGGGGGSEQQERAPVLLCDKIIEKVF